MPIPSTIDREPAVLCPVARCTATARWWLVYHGTTSMRVAACTGHGIVYKLSSANTVIPYGFARAHSPAEVQHALNHPGLCIVCHKNPNLRCTIMLCSDCCARLRIRCRLLDHRALGQAMYPHIQESSFQEVDVRDVRAGDRIKMRISCTHVWPDTPVREEGWETYSITVCTRASHRHYTRYHELADTEDTMCALRLDGIAINRILYNANDEDGDWPVAGVQAFYQGRAIYDVVQGHMAELRLLVMVDVEELGRHVTPLLPEELDLERDWTTLGTVFAHVQCKFASQSEAMGWRTVEMPRRRLKMADCLFYLTDFSAEARAVLGIQNISDELINDGPNVALVVEPYDEGGEVTDIEIWLYVKDA